MCMEKKCLGLYINLQVSISKQCYKNKIYAFNCHSKIFNTNNYAILAENMT